MLEFAIGEQVKVIGNHYDYMSKGLLGIIEKQYPFDTLQYGVRFIRDDGKLPMEFIEFIDEKDLSHVELKSKE